MPIHALTSNHRHNNIVRVQKAQTHSIRVYSKQWVRGDETLVRGIVRVYIISERPIGGKKRSSAPARTYYYVHVRREGWLTREWAATVPQRSGGGG